MNDFKPAEEIKVSKDIVLRRFSHDTDEAKYNAIITSREHLLPWLPWAHFYKEFKEMLDFTDLQIKCFDEGSVLGYDIFYQGEFAGSIDLHNLSDANRSCEIGYWLDKNHTGKGIITRAADTITKYAFDELDMHRVVIRAASQNKASCAVAERLNFTLEGTLRDNELLDGKYYDVNVYAKLNQLHANER